jgi:hypothetical protein
MVDTTTMKGIKKEFLRLAKNCQSHNEFIPEKIRELINRPEYTEYLELLILGGYLALNHEIKLDGYATDNSKPDKCRATQVIDCMTDERII